MGISSTNNLRALAVFNFVSLIIHISFSWLTQFKLVNERNVGEILNRYPSLFTPASFTFGIWGIIYISLFAFCIYHLLMAWQHSPLHSANIDLARTGNWFVVNNLFAAAWLIAWANNLLLISLLLIVVQLTALIIINLKVDIHNIKRTWRSKTFTQFPLSIYFGWITIATIANAAAYLVFVNGAGGFMGLPSINWTMIMIGAVVLLTLIVVIARRNVVYGLVVIWALYGIVMKRQYIDRSLYIDIINIGWLGIGIIATACLSRFVLNLIISYSRTNFPVASQPIK